LAGQSKVERVAEWLLRQQAERRRYEMLPPDLRLADATEAYAVQTAFQTLQRNTKGPLVGGKIALTTPVMQELVNYRQPMAGGLLARTVRHTRSELPWGDFVHPLVECEVAVELGADLDQKSAPHTVTSVAASVIACMAAIEVADDRAADYKALDPLLLIAENAWNHGCVVGPRVTDWRALDLPKAKGTMRIGGTEVGSGHAGDVMGGHPFAALAWLANHAVARGSKLAKGDIVLTGSLVASKWPARGEDVEVSIEGLGEARVRFV
jgi:2-oxo-3-hexenedioate decarboxylase/2-keto-4-pentenoate hydratase